MRQVLTAKLALDGVEYDEFVLKTNLRNMLRGRFRAMREQIAYKLPAMLRRRIGLPPETRETCFGDDAEADGFIYCLYGDIIAGRVERRLLEQILERAGAYDDDAQPRGDARRRAADGRGGAAHLHPPRSPLADLALRSLRRAPVPVFNYFQAAMVMFEDGQLAVPSVVRVALEMVDRYGYTIDALRNSLQDLLRRGRLRHSTARALADQLTARGHPAAGRAAGGARAAHLVRRARAPARRRALDAVPLDTPIDYLAALEADLPRKGKKRTDIAPPLT